MIHKVQHKTTTNIYEHSISTATHKNTCTRIMYNNIPFPNSHTWYPRPSLSTSSISISGFSVCTFFKLCITLPGIAPTYVLLCPFISATSVIPPTLNLKYYQTHTHCHCCISLLYSLTSLFNARAIERAILVLPAPTEKERDDQ